LTARTRVSVVISAYTEDRWSDLCAAVSSLTRQSAGAPEIVVVVDHNVGLLRRAAGELGDVALAVPNGETRGLSGARNSGIAASRGEIIAFMDDDACAERDWLERLLASYEDPVVIGAGGRIEPAWDAARPGYFPREFDWVVGCSYRGMPNQRAEVRNVIGANMSFRREAFELAGGFISGIGRVDALPVGCEETEFCIRVRRRLAGRPIVYEPSAVVYHRVPVGRASARYFFSRCLAEGRSKAIVARLAGFSGALETERRYVTRALPRAVARSVRELLRGDPAALARIAMIVAGLLVTSIGYAVGTVHGVRIRRRADTP
jgi:GT2 family glycosyltransferase